MCERRREHEGFISLDNRVERATFDGEAGVPRRTADGGLSSKFMTKIDK